MAKGAAIGFFGGLFGGLLAGQRAARQQAIDAANAKFKERQLALQEQIAKYTEEARGTTESRLARTQAMGEFNKPIDALLGKYPELATELGNLGESASGYASAPTPEARAPFIRQRGEALTAAAEHARQLREEGYSHDLQKIQSAVESRVGNAFAQKEKQSEEMLRRSIAQQLAIGKINLPEGMTVDQVVQNIRGGEGIDYSKLPKVVPNAKIQETLASFDALEQQVNRVAQLKGRINTGVGPEIAYAVPRLLGMEPKERLALRADIIALTSQYLKAQTGVQYGFREAQWLMRALPKMTDDDAQFVRSLGEFKKRVEIVKQARLARLRAGRVDVENLVPGLGAAPSQAPGGEGSGLPEGFEPLK